MELRDALLEVLGRKQIEPKQAERLRGRMQWFEGRAFGRVAQYSLKVLGEISLRRRQCVELSTEELRAIEFLVKRVSEAQAIHISPIFLETFLVFTDGACEGDEMKTGGVGGVLVDPSGRCVNHFSSEVTAVFMGRALEFSANPIYELELLPILIAISLWGKFFRSSHVVFYLGNDAARAALCRGYGATKLSQKLVQAVMNHECDLELKSWYARVPTHSNIADGPSRLSCTEVEQLGSLKTEVDWIIFPEDFFL